MSNRRRKRSRRSNHGSNIVSSAALIVIAVLLLIFVYFYINNNNFSDIGSMFSKDREEQQTATEKETSAADSDAVDKTGLVEDDNGHLMYVLTDDEADIYESEHISETDGRKLLIDSWYEDGDSLIYFSEDGVAVDNYTEGAMQYGFDSDYHLSSIKYNDAYVSDSESDTSDYPGVVQTKTLWAFLDTQKSLGDLCAVKYKKTTESFSHSLGSDSSPQYTSRFAMSVADGYIYYAAFTDSSDKLTESIANKLFRMKPGADYRELGAEDIRGYKVYEAPDGSISVYSDNGHKVSKVSRFEKDDSTPVFSEDASYYVDITSGKTVLMLEGGYPVTLQSSAFKAGNFTYALNADGEITSVAAKTQVSTGGYTYTVENGDSFGSKKARVLRSSAGQKQVISAEFDGSVGNLHYDFDSSKIIAEYIDKAGEAGIISITLDGDVDVLYDASGLGSSCTLYSIQDGYVIVKTSDNSEPFKKAKIAASYPLAVGIDPVDIEEDDTESSMTDSAESSSADSTGGSTGAHESGNSDSGKHSSQNSSETAAAPSSNGSGDNNVSSNSGSHAQGANDTTIINNNTVEKKGPGVS